MSQMSRRQSSAKLASLLQGIKCKRAQRGDEPRDEPVEQKAEQREAGLTPARYQAQEGSKRRQAAL